jgi:hypothetical protein
MADYIETAGMLANRLRPLVLAACDGPPPGRFGSSCISGTPMIPLHRATLTAIYQHLERLAEQDGEVTDRAMMLGAIVGAPAIEDNRVWVGTGY